MSSRDLPTLAPREHPTSPPPPTDHPPDCDHDNTSLPVRYQLLLPSYKREIYCYWFFLIAYSTISRRDVNAGSSCIKFEHVDVGEADD